MNTGTKRDQPDTTDDDDDDGSHGAGGSGAGAGSAHASSHPTSRVRTAEAEVVHAAVTAPCRIALRHADVNHNHHAAAAEQREAVRSECRNKNAAGGPCDVCAWVDVAYDVRLPSCVQKGCKEPPPKAEFTFEDTCCVHNCKTHGPHRVGCSHPGCTGALVFSRADFLFTCKVHGEQRRPTKIVKHYRVGTRSDHLRWHQALLLQLRSDPARLAKRLVGYAMHHGGVGFKTFGIDMDVDGLPENANKALVPLLYALLTVTPAAAAKVLSDAGYGGVRLVLVAARNCSRPDKLSAHVWYGLVNAAGGRVGFYNAGDLFRFLFAVLDEVETMALVGDADAQYLRCYKRSKNGELKHAFAIDPMPYRINSCFRADDHRKYDTPESAGFALSRDDLRAFCSQLGRQPVDMRCLTPLFGSDPLDADARFMESLLTCERSDPTIVLWLPFEKETTLRQMSAGPPILSTAPFRDARYTDSGGGVAHQPLRAYSDWRSIPELLYLLSNHVLPPGKCGAGSGVQLQWGCKDDGVSFSLFGGMSAAKLRYVRELLLATPDRWPFGEVGYEQDALRHLAFDLDDAPWDDEFWLLLYEFMHELFDNAHAATFGVVSYDRATTLERTHVVWPFTKLTQHNVRRVREALLAWLQTLPKYAGYNWASVVDGNVTKMQCIGSSKEKKGRLVLRLHVGVGVEDVDGAPAVRRVFPPTADSNCTGTIAPKDCFFLILDDEPMDDLTGLPEVTITTLPAVAVQGGGGRAASVELPDAVVAALEQELQKRCAGYGPPRGHTIRTSQFKSTGKPGSLVTEFNTNSQWCALVAHTWRDAPAGHSVHDDDCVRGKSGPALCVHKSRGMWGHIDWANNEVVLRCRSRLHKVAAMLDFGSVIFGNEQVLRWQLVDPTLLAHAVTTRAAAVIPIVVAGPPSNAAEFDAMITESTEADESVLREQRWDPPRQPKSDGPLPPDLEYLKDHVESVRQVFSNGSYFVQAVGCGLGGDTNDATARWRNVTGDVVFGALGGLQGIPALEAVWVSSSLGCYVGRSPGGALVVISAATVVVAPNVPDGKAWDPTLATACEFPSPRHGIGRAGRVELLCPATQLALFCPTSPMGSTFAWLHPGSEHEGLERLRDTWETLTASSKGRQPPHLVFHPGSHDLDAVRYDEASGEPEELVSLVSRTRRKYEGNGVWSTTSRTHKKALDVATRELLRHARLLPCPRPMLDAPGYTSVDQQARSDVSVVELRPHVEAAKQHIALGRTRDPAVPATGFILALQSHVGTAKTQAVRGLMEMLRQEFAHTTILSLSARRKLACELAQVLGLDNYLNDSDKVRPENVMRKSRGLVISMDSLLRVVDMQSDERWDVLFLDELLALIAHFSASTLAGTALEVFRCFLHVARHSDLVITADANLSADSLRFLGNMCHGHATGPRVLFRNDWHRERTERVVWAPHKDAEAYVRRISMWNRGKAHDDPRRIKVVIVSNDASLLVRLFAMIAFHDPDGEQLIITGQSQNIGDPNTLWPTKDYIGCSPAVESGVSCTVPFAHRVIGFFRRQSNSPEAARQMLARVRALVTDTFDQAPVIVLVLPAPPKPGAAALPTLQGELVKIFRDTGATHTEMRKTGAHERAMALSAGLTGNAGDSVKLEFTGLLAQHRVLEAASQASYGEDLIRMLREAGHTVELSLEGLRPSIADVVPAGESDEIAWFDAQLERQKQDTREKLELTSEEQRTAMKSAGTTTRDNPAQARAFVDAFVELHRNGTVLDASCLAVVLYAKAAKFYTGDRYGFIADEIVDGDTRERRKRFDRLSLALAHGRLALEADIEEIGGAGTNPFHRQRALAHRSALRELFAGLRLPHVFDAHGWSRYRIEEETVEDMRLADLRDVIKAHPQELADLRKCKHLDDDSPLGLVKLAQKVLLHLCIPSVLVNRQVTIVQTQWKPLQAALLLRLEHLHQQCVSQRKTVHGAFCVAAVARDDITSGSRARAWGDTDADAPRRVFGRNAEGVRIECSVPYDYRTECDNLSDVAPLEMVALAATLPLHVVDDPWEPTDAELGQVSTEYNGDDELTQTAILQLFFRQARPHGDLPSAMDLVYIDGNRLCAPTAHALRIAVRVSRRVFSVNTSSPQRIHHGACNVTPGQWATARNAVFERPAPRPLLLAAAGPVLRIAALATVPNMSGDGFALVYLRLQHPAHSFVVAIATQEALTAALPAGSAQRHKHRVHAVSTQSDMIACLVGLLHKHDVDPDVLAMSHATLGAMTANKSARPGLGRVAEAEDSAREIVSLANGAVSWCGRIVVATDPPVDADPVPNRGKYSASKASVERLRADVSSLRYEATSGIAVALQQWAP